MSGSALAATRRSVHGDGRASHRPCRPLLRALMGLLVVFTVTAAGPRIGLAATVRILFAGQLALGGLAVGAALSVRK